MKYALKKGDNLLICVVANGRRGVWRMNNFEYECSDHEVDKAISELEPYQPENRDYFLVELRIGTDSPHCAKY